MKKLNSVYARVLITSILFLPGFYVDAQDKIAITTPMVPPEWALMERQIIQSCDEAISVYYDHFFDESGTYLHVPRWGMLDGCDDVIEITKLWPIMYSLGASDKVMELYHKVLEGALRQYADVKTVSTDVAKDGSYYREFEPMVDFMHQGEGIQGLMSQGLCEPNNLLMQKRYKRFAGFYMDEDPDALNYDPELNIIRSFQNGSKGPQLREGNAYDWGGDYTEGKFNMIHHKNAGTTMRDYGEEYQGIIDHWYFFPQSTAGDHPLNLVATQLALDAYMIDNEGKYRDWLLKYAGGWRDRAAANNGNFPTNVGLDGITGHGVADKWYFDKKSEKEKWYMGTYGWNFSFYHWREEVYHENNSFYGIWPGMANAYLLTGDVSYVDALRKQMDNLFANKKTIDGKDMIPKNYGIHIDRDQPRKFNVFDVKDGQLFVPDGKGVEGWYNWTPNLKISELIDIYLMSMDKNDLKRIPNIVVNQDQKEEDNSTFDPWKSDRSPLSGAGWISFLEGKNKSFPEESMKDQMRFIREQMKDMRNETSTPDTRLADWAIEFNPANNAGELARLMMGANFSGRIWSIHARVRYFDPDKNRAGLPEDLAALVTKMEDGKTWLTLVNTNQSKSRKVIIQTGAFGEHQCLSVKVDNKEYPVNNRSFTVHLDPGAGSEIEISAKRYANQPTWSFPW